MTFWMRCNYQVPEPTQPELAPELTACEDPRPEIDVTQSDLAHLANLSRAAVVKQLQALEREGQITRSYGCVTLLDPAAMRARMAIRGG